MEHDQAAQIARVISESQGQPLTKARAASWYWGLKEYSWYPDALAVAGKVCASIAHPNVSDYVNAYRAAHPYVIPAVPDEPIAPPEVVKHWLTRIRGEMRPTP